MGSLKLPQISWVIATFAMEGNSFNVNGFYGSRHSNVIAFVNAHEIQEVLKKM